MRTKSANYSALAHSELARIKRRLSSGANDLARAISEIVRVYLHSKNLALLRKRDFGANLILRRERALEKCGVDRSLCSSFQRPFKWRENVGIKTLSCRIGAEKEEKEKIYIQAICIRAKRELNY